MYKKDIGFLIQELASFKQNLHNLDSFCPVVKTAVLESPKAPNRENSA